MSVSFLTYFLPSKVKDPFHIPHLTWIEHMVLATVFADQSALSGWCGQYHTPLFFHLPRASFLVSILGCVHLRVQVNIIFFFSFILLGYWTHNPLPLSDGSQAILLHLLPELHFHSRLLQKIIQHPFNKVAFYFLCVLSMGYRPSTKSHTAISCIILHVFHIQTSLSFSSPCVFGCCVYFFALLGSEKGLFSNTTNWLSQLPCL